MSTSNHNTAAKGITGGIVLDDTTLINSMDSAEGEAYRRTISHIAWDALSPSDKLALQEAAKTVAGDDAELDAAYFQAVLIADYVASKQSNRIKTDPSNLLAPAEYRFWS